MADSTAVAAIVLAESTADAAAELTESTALVTESTALFKIEEYDPHHDDPEACSSWVSALGSSPSCVVFSFFGDDSGLFLHAKKHEFKTQ